MLEAVWVVEASCTDCTCVTSVACTVAQNGFMILIYKALTFGLNLEVSVGC